MLWRVVDVHFEDCVITFSDVLPSEMWNWKPQLKARQPHRPRRRSRISTPVFLKKSRVECSPMFAEVTDVWSTKKVTEFGRLNTAPAGSKRAGGQN